ncbi:hypothetical protein, partial [Xanthomonas hortorum]
MTLLLRSNSLQRWCIGARDRTDVWNAGAVRLASCCSLKKKRRLSISVGSAVFFMGVAVEGAVPSPLTGHAV